MEKMTSNKEQEAMIAGAIYRPEKKPFIEEAKTFLYDSDTGAVLGRTPVSWAKIIIFYIIFYTCLAAFWALMMLVTYYTLDPRIPKYQQDYSLIGTNPALGFRPMPNDTNSLSTLIWYKGTERENFAYWVDTLTEFLDEYNKPGSTPGRGANIFNCNYDREVPPGKVCGVDILHNMGPCTKEKNFNYHVQSPCVFIKLNKIFGWKPEFYTEPNELPAKMPASLKKKINDTFYENKNKLKTVWVSCGGESPADVENVGEVKYHPEQGFPGYYFPYENSEGYLSPLVAIEFQKPKTGILINVECRAWAKNIKHDRKYKLGIVHFELMID